MDQLKDFLRQCVKYRFWIAFGVSLLLPIIGYFVGSGAITSATTKREAEIKGAKTEIGKYTSPGIVNAQYQPIAAEKKEVLTKDVAATWRKLYALQEPLLKWPEDVEERFRKWGRKFPNDVDKGQVQSTLIDYSLLYPAFVTKVYKTFKPFNFEDGSGIVVAPDENTLIRPAAFLPDSPPELGKVWAEQDRLWVLTALLDVVAKVNESVGAKDWDGAIVKQINLVEVGAQTDQDQVSMVKNQTLVAAEPILPEGAASAPPPAAAAPLGPGGPPGMLMVGSGAGAAATDEVYYIKTEGNQFKILPIKMNVLVEQSKLPDFLVGLENSPMAIQVMEIELAKPLAPVVKPVYGEKPSFNMGIGGMAGMEGMGMGAPGMMGMMGGRGMMPGAPYGNRGGGGGMNEGMMGMMGGMGRMGGAAPAAKKGTDMRSVNKAAERVKANKKAVETKHDNKSKVDQYYNIVELTVYGQARFFLTPPPLPELPPSTASTPPPATPESTKGEAPKAEAPGTPEPAKKAEEPKKDEAPKSEAPKAAEPAPTPAPNPETPKVEAPKAEAPKAESPKADAPKSETASPKR